MIKEKKQKYFHFPLGGILTKKVISEKILNLLKKINNEFGVTIILITHSLSVAAQVCKNIVVLDSGKIVEIGSVSQFLTSPQSEVAKSLISIGGYGNAA